MNKKVIIFGVLILIALNVFVFSIVRKPLTGNVISDNQSILNSSTITTQSSNSDNNIQSNTNNGIIFDELSKHNSRSDCWMVVNGKVYDATSYLKNGGHPKNIDYLCGKDATKVYPHSDSKLKILKYLGELEG